MNDTTNNTETFTPNVGLVVTYQIGSDRYDATIKQVAKTALRVEMHRGQIETFTKRGDGSWRPAGSKAGKLIPHRPAYLDLTF